MGVSIGVGGGGRGEGGNSIRVMAWVISLTLIYKAGNSSTGQRLDQRVQLSLVLFVMIS